MLMNPEAEAAHQLPLTSTTTEKEEDKDKEEEEEKRRRLEKERNAVPRTRGVALRRLCSPVAEGEGGCCSKNGNDGNSLGLLLFEPTWM